jgi:hypothetical protein
MLERLMVTDALTLAQVGGLPIDLLAPADPLDNEAWFERLISYVDGTLTFDVAITGRLDAGDLWGALRLHSFAPGDQLRPDTHFAIEVRWRTLVEATRAQRRRIEVALESVGEVEGELEALVFEQRADFAHLRMLPDALPSSDQLPALQSLLQQWERREQEVDALVVMARGAHREVRDRLVLGARLALERLLGPALDVADPERALAERALRALPALILKRRTSPVLDRLADPAVSLASIETLLPVLETEASAPPHPLPIVRPSSYVAGSAEPHARPLTAARLTPHGQSLIARAGRASEGIASRAYFFELKDQLAREPDVLRRGQEWLSRANATSDETLRMAALGEGFAEYADDAIVTTKSLPGLHHLRNALAAFGRAGDLADETGPRVFRSLVAVVFALWRDTGRGEESELAPWRDDPDRLFEEVIRRRALPVIVREWREMIDETGAAYFLARLCEAVPEPADVLAQAASVLLNHVGIVRHGERSVRRLLNLLAPARPPQALARLFDRLAEELSEVKGQVKPAVAQTLAGLAGELRTGLERLPLDSPAPVSVILDELPGLLEAAARVPTGEAQVTVKPLVGAFYPADRCEDVELPVRVSNQEDAAPASDVTVTLGEAEGDPEWRPTLERKGPIPIAELGSGETREVRFWITMRPDVATHLTELSFPVQVKLREKVYRSLHRIPIRPTSRESYGSPYQPGVAVSGEHFIGRQKELKAVLGSILGTGAIRPVLVHGIRRIGKSSILKFIKDHAEVRRSYFPVYWSPEDRSFSDNSCDFLTILTEKIREALPLEVRQRLPFRRQDFREDPFAAFERFMLAFNDLHQGKQILLLLDEIDKVYAIIEAGRARAGGGPPPRPQEAILPEVFGALRKCMMEHQCLNVVFAGLPVSLRKISYEDRLFGLLDPVPVGPFTEREAAEVVDAGKQILAEVAPEARRRLHELSGLQPYLLQVICQQLFVRMKHQGRDTVTLGDVDAVVQESVLPNESIFSDYRPLMTPEVEPLLRALASAVRDQRTRRYANVRMVAEKLASHGDLRSETEVKAALDALASPELGETTFDRPLVTRFQDNRYRLVIGLIGEYLLREE